MSYNCLPYVFADRMTAGYTYCAFASLSLLDRLPKKTETHDTTSNKRLPGLTNLPATIRWLVSRQTEYFPAETDDEQDETPPPQLPLQEQRNALAGIYKDSTGLPSLADLSIHDSHFVGFNGRSNKRVDTCYAFWVTAALAVCMSSISLD